jgi:hypothetical protein
MEFEERVQFVSPPRERESSGVGTNIDAVSGEATFMQADRPGFYTVSRKSRSGTEHLELKAVNVNSQEGDIRQLDVTEIADLLRPVNLSAEAAANFTTAGDFSGEQSASDWLFYAAILCLLGEMFLAGRILPSSVR